MVNSMLTTREHYDLSNLYQRREAGGLIYRIALQACNGSLGGALMLSERPAGWEPTLDGRSAEMKEYRSAEKAMWDAIQRYDKARIAAISKAKGGAA